MMMRLCCKGTKKTLKAYLDDSYLKILLLKPENVTTKQHCAIIIISLDQKLETNKKNETRCVCVCMCNYQ